jgi:hypothetical protein
MVTNVDLHFLQIIRSLIILYKELKSVFCNVCLIGLLSCARADKYRVGASAHVTEKHAKYDLEITKSLENEKIMYSSKGIARGISHLTLTYTLKPVERGTEVTYACACWGWGPICSICGLIGDKMFGVEASLNNLKSILEK